ncbi:unnamed protein product [Closterium sp. NIES-64]|nr:unnamed protein product [Closterium sp. NIES-64]
MSLADPSGGPVLSRFSTVLPCPAAPSGTLSGLYLPLFSTNLVSGADLQDAGVHQFTPARQRVTHCTEASTGRHLATFTRQPGSSLYTLTTASPRVAESGRVPSSGQVFATPSRSGPESAPCSCRRLSHETLLWHHRLGHPSLLRLRGMASRLLVSGLPRSLPPLPQGPGPACVPCVEGRQRAAPHSSQFPPTEAPLQTLHMDVWGPARVRRLGHERYFLLVVDDYSHYTLVFPLRSKGDVTEVLIDWIRAALLKLRHSFGLDFPVLRLHSDRGEEFSSCLLRAYCRARGIRQTFTLPDSPQQNGIAERRIGMVMDVARTSMMHAAAPHFPWPFEVRYAAHQINLHPRVSRPETSPALLWTGKVGDASAFRVWGSRAFVCDLFADKLFPRAAPCVFLGFLPDAPGWQFYHPTSRRVLSSQDVTFDESVPYYRLFPYRTPSLPPPPLFLVPGPPPVDPLPPQGPAPSGVSHVDAVEPVEVKVTLVLLWVLSLGVLSLGVLSLGVLSLGVPSLGVQSLGVLRLEVLRPELLRVLRLAESHSPRRSCVSGLPGVLLVLEVLRLLEVPGGARTGSTGAAGPAGSTGAGAAERVGAETTAGGLAGNAPGAAGGFGATGGATGGAAGGATGGSRATGGAAGGATGGSGAAGGTGAVTAVCGVASRPRPYFVPLLQQVLGLTPSPSPSPPPLEGPQPVQSESQLQPASPLPAPSPYAGPSGGLSERREPASRPASPVRTARTSGRGSRQRPPPVPGTHRMSLRPSSAPLCVPLPSPPASSLPALADPESDSLRAASPTVTRLLATAVTDPSFESSAASALVTELVDFAARCRLDYAASLVVESTGTYVDAVPPPGANIVSGMWIFRVKRPPGSPPVFKARYVARGFSQRQGVDYFQTFSPTPKMTTLRVLLHVAAHRDYELHSLDFSTAFLQGSLHEEIWLRRPPGFTGSFPPGTQWSL